jgi:hypothetical protein
MNKVDDTAVRAELAELRRSLAALEVPALDEQALRARFRAAAARRPQRAAAQLPSRAARYLAAAGVLLAVGSALLLAWPTQNEQVPELTAAPAAEPSSRATQPFQPLPGSPGISPTASFSVVRVQIPLASLAIVPGSEQGGTIEADLLVGEDGLAHGIRFTEGGAALGSARAQ